MFNELRVTLLVGNLSCIPHSVLDMSSLLAHLAPGIAYSIRLGPGIAHVVFASTPCPIQ